MEVEWLNGQIRPPKFDLHVGGQIWLHKLLIKIFFSVLYGFDLHYGSRIQYKSIKDFFWCHLELDSTAVQSKINPLNNFYWVSTGIVFDRSTACDRSTAVVFDTSGDRLLGPEKYWRPRFVQIYL